MSHTKLDQLTDEAIVELVRSKNPEFYAEIVKRYQAKLLRYVQTMTSHYDQATDVVQETFIKAYQNLNSFKTTKKFSSWIYRIAHNQAINEIKKRKREHSLEQHQWPEEIFQDSTDLQQQIEDKEVIKMVQAGLKKLPVKYKQVIALKYLEEKSYEEISDILRLPINTVGTNLSRAKKMLASIYQQEQHV